VRECRRHNPAFKERVADLRSGGRTYAQVAREIGVPKGVVAGVLHRLRAQANREGEG
jgi:transposase-like protein